MHPHHSAINFLMDKLLTFRPERRVKACRGAKIWRRRGQVLLLDEPRVTQKRRSRCKMAKIDC
jgi:hypothetical protein